MPFTEEKTGKYSMQTERDTELVRIVKLTASSELLNSAKIIFARRAGGPVSDKHWPYLVFNDANSFDKQHKTRTSLRKFTYIRASAISSWQLIIEIICKI